MVEKEKIIEESRILYTEIDSCITELLGARTTHNSEEEGKALFRMEGLMVGVLQHLSCIIDTLPEQPVELLEEKDFVEEVRQYYSNNCTWDALKQPMLSIITRCARHFAEWGAEHLKI